MKRYELSFGDAGDSFLSTDYKPMTVLSSLSGGYNLIFTNSGNQQYAVLDIQLIIAGVKSGIRRAIMQLMRNRRASELRDCKIGDVAAGGSAALSESDDLIDRTITVFQPQTDRRLSREDGREIISNMTGFLRILQEWRCAERAAQGELPGCQRANWPARTRSLQFKKLPSQ